MDYINTADIASRIHFRKTLKKEYEDACGPNPCGPLGISKQTKNEYESDRWMSFGEIADQPWFDTEKKEWGEKKCFIPWFDIHMGNSYNRLLIIEIMEEAVKNAGLTWWGEFSI